jgi:carnitine 3-dehydrogenase
LNKPSITLLGVGTIGASWAALFLSKGAYVSVFDPDENALVAAKDQVTAAWGDLIMLNPTIADLPWGRLLLTTDIGKACDKPNWVQENAPDRIELKRELLAKAETFLPIYTPIASSTTALLATDIQKGMKHPERFLVGHPFNPPHLIPLVEIVSGDKTDAALPDRAKAFYESFDKEVIIAKREAIGHIANRLNAALYREVVHMVQSGIATVEDIDRAMTHGPGLRWAFLGPNMVYHLGGGEGGYSQYLEHLGPSQEARWQDLGTANLDEATKAILLAQFEKSFSGEAISDLRKYRDSALIGLLKLKKQLGKDHT